jgi:hypothetical protein
MGRALAKPMDDWQARDDFDTLMRAHQITNDPNRHKAAKAHAKSRLEAIKGLTDDGKTVRTKGSKQAATKPGR